MPPPPRDKTPTPQELHDWAIEVQEVAPYGEPLTVPEIPPQEAAEKPQKAARPAPLLRRKPTQALPERLAPLVVGQYHGVDKRTADRIRRGRLSIDAVLDLHGLRELEAAEAFYHFIQTQQTDGARTVLVITGQGLRSGKGPILQQAVQRWVNEPLLRPFIVAIDYATRAQGGKGAYTIYLRRTRQYE